MPRTKAPASRRSSTARPGAAQRRRAADIAPARAARPLWLGLDIGTGGARAVLVDDRGRVRAGATAPHAAIAMPHPLWAEQQPEDWWRAARRAIHAVLHQAAIAPAAIAAVGLTGQMHGVVLLDAAGAVLAPAIIWCDGRAQAECDAWTERLGAERIIAWTGNPMLVGFSAPKLSWTRHYRPAVWRSARHFLLPKDFVRFRLTGECATDVADASGTGLFDVRHRRWSQEMLAAMDISRQWLPAAFEGPEICARVSSAGARATGLAEGTPVVAGGGDQAAGAVGNGVVSEGLASVTVGTSGVVFAATSQMRLDPQGRVHAFCHAVPGQWHVMAVTQSAGLSLRWLRDTLGAQPGAGDAYDRLCREALRAAPGAGGLLFLPYLMGERTPHLDPLARGAWIGLTAAHRRPELIRAVLEGVAFSLLDGLEIIQAMGIRPQRLALSGGGARGRVWPRIQADVFALPCLRWNRDEGAAHGAALLAMAAASPGQSAPAPIQEIASRGLHPAAEWAPSAADRPLYSAAYAAYRDCYPRLQTLFPRLSAACASAADDLKAAARPAAANN